MKKNWVKGLDRIAILLAIPITIWGAHYSSKKYAEAKGVGVYITAEDEEELKTTNIFLSLVDSEYRVFGFAKEKGIIANGKKELEQKKLESPMAKKSLDRAISQGADPCGTLIQPQRFGLSEECCPKLIYLLPRTSKRYCAGMLGGFGFAIATILGIGLSTRVIPRTFRWVREGFYEEKT